MPSLPDRRWTLEAARALFPDVRSRTERAVVEVEKWMSERESLDPKGAPAQDLDQRIRARVAQWAREMEALGVDVKGPWLVDFDTGAGYYCWRWPESDLAYFHGYEDGFEGRIRIQ